MLYYPIPITPHTYTKQNTVAKYSSKTQKKRFSNINVPLKFKNNYVGSYNSQNITHFN